MTAHFCATQKQYIHEERKLFSSRLGHGCKMEESDLVRSLMFCSSDLRPLKQATFAHFDAF